MLDSGAALEPSLASLGRGARRDCGAVKGEPAYNFVSAFTEYATIPTNIPMASPTLSPQQAHALFDILTHDATYTEIQRYKYPTGIEDYGPPFELAESKASESPILQTLLYRFVLTLPGLKDIGSDFWRKRIEDLVRKFGEAELSESYDKGTIGSRRTLATAIATLVEYPTRGVLGGLAKTPAKAEDEQYDLSDPEDVKNGWEDFLQEMVYGDMIDHLIEKIGETDRLEDQTMRVQATHEFILIKYVILSRHYILALMHTIASLPSCITS